MFVHNGNRSSVQFFSFLFLLAAVPLSITTYLYNQSDLPKYTTLVIFGSIFLILTLIFSISYLFKTSQKPEEIVLEFDCTFDPFVLLFLISAVISTVFSLNPEVSFYGQYERQIGLVTYIYLFLIYCFSSNIFKDEDRRKQTLFVIELVAAAVALYAIIQASGWDPFGIQPAADKRPASTLGNSVFTGGFLAMILPFSFLNASNKKSIILKIFFPLIVLSGIIVTRTRSAYLAVILQFIVVAVSYLIARRSGSDLRKKFRYIFIALVAAFTLIALLWLLFPENPFAVRLTSIFFSGNNPRWVLWQDAFNIFKKYPLIGPGVAMFPAAFEEFYSAGLRSEDVLKYFDSPHNNYLQVLYTMGALGLTAYLMIIVQGVRVCIKQILRQEKSKKKENNTIDKSIILFLSFLAMLAGYAVYGLTNFDEITILLYFFVFLSMLRSLNPEDKKRELKMGIQFRIPLLVLSILLLIFTCYNMYISVNNVRADRYFLEGEKNFASRRYADGVNNLNESIRLNSSNPVYKLMLAINVYEMLTANRQLSGENRDKLLKQAAENIINARKNHYNKNRCDAVLSLIYFEMGKKDEAESIKQQVLAGDPVNIIYRLSLTVHYVEANVMDSAKEQLESVLSTNYSAMNVWSVAAFYYEKTNNPDEVKKYCLKIMEADPQNQYAREFLNNHK